MNKKKEKIQIYRALDKEYWASGIPSNPGDFIDKKTQKETINPGIPYVSTSQNAVFERRIRLKKKEFLNKLNKFIAAPEDDEEVTGYIGE